MIPYILLVDRDCRDFMATLVEKMTDNYSLAIVGNVQEAGRIRTASHPNAILIDQGKLPLTKSPPDTMRNMDTVVVAQGVPELGFDIDDLQKVIDHIFSRNDLKILYEKADRQAKQEHKVLADNLTEAQGIVAATERKSGIVKPTKPEG